MDFFSMEFVTALAAIVVIDLVLAGDNAIVIALAARNVPRHLQRRAMIWGALGAVLVRSILTLMVVWLLKFPGLLFVGGAMLVWIARKLLIPEAEAEHADEPETKSASTFWGAIRTIVVADMVMGLDNVIGVAGAAHGNFVLVVLGLLISIPVLVWGSSLLLRYLERFPALVYVGAAVLALTAAKMMTSEPLVRDVLSRFAPAVPLVYLITVGGVLWAGFLENHRRLESRISERLASLHKRPATDSMTGRGPEVGFVMEKILVPVDGSPNAARVAHHIVAEIGKSGGLQVHLLNVQTPLSRHVAQFVARKSRDDYHRDAARKALRSVHKILDGAGVPYTTHVEVGNKAEIITQMAQQLGCDHIVMSTARKNSLTRMLEASTTNRVLERTTVPVEIIAGDSVSTLERVGVPLGLALVAAWLLIHLVE